MSTQKELELENQFIEHLTTLGYERVQYRNETALLANLKNQIEKFNALTAPLTHEQWGQVWNYLRYRLGSQSGFEIIRPINNLFDRQSDVLKRHNTDV